MGEAAGMLREQFVGNFRTCEDIAQIAQGA